MGHLFSTSQSEVFRGVWGLSLKLLGLGFRVEGLAMSQGLLFKSADGFLSLGAPSGIPKTEGYNGIVYRILSHDFN